MKRERYEVLPTPRTEVQAGARDWRITRNQDVMGHADTQREGIEVATTFARLRWELYGQTAELTIKRATGEIRDKRTYGLDREDIEG